nr:hypothetical protein [uncultured Enterobacter sp.]
MTLKRFKESCAFCFSNQGKSYFRIQNLDVKHISTAINGGLLKQADSQKRYFSSVSLNENHFEMLF